VDFEMKSLLVIPTYNCEKQIARLLKNSADAINTYFDEVLVIDNGSRDETVNSTISSMDVIKISAKVIQNKENISLGGSLKTGFLYASQNAFDYVGVLHGDDQANLSDLLPILMKLKQDGVDLAIGARFHSKSNLIGYSNFRKIGNRLLNLYCIICTRRKIDDLIAGLNLFKVSKLDVNQILSYPDDLTFDVHILLRAIHLKHKIEFFPITWTEDDQVSNAKVVRQATIILGLLTKYLLFRDKALNFPKSERSYKNFAVVFERDPRND
jgi:glycosyltransferase involved in cell wall biosynthesis